MVSSTQLMKNQWTCGFILALVVLTSLPGRAVEPRTRFFRDLALGGGLHFQRWSGEGELRIREISLPVSFVCPVSRRLSLEVNAGSGVAKLERGASSSLGGLTDTQLRASFILGDEVALLTAGISLPTGQAELDPGEQQVSNYLAQNALGFRTPHFGQGLNATVGLAAARKVGASVAGLGIGYLLKGEFSPWKGGAEYRPGDELSLTVGLDRQILDGDGRVSLDVVYTRYGKDELGGVKTFQAGDKLLVQALGLFQAKGLDWQIYLVERGRGKNTNYWSGVQAEYRNGNQFEARLTALRSPAGRVGWRGLLSVKLYRDNEFDQGEATLVGLGPGIRYRLSPQRYLDLNLQYGRGRIDGAAVKGIDMGASVWLGI